MRETTRETTNRHHDHYRYSAWNGEQTVATLTPDAVLRSLDSALLSGGIEQALDRALHRGLTKPDGEALAGLDRLRDETRAERRRLDEALVERLRELASALRDGIASAAGGSETLDAESSRLLALLARQPSSAARLLAHLDAHSRDTLIAALDGERRASLGAGGGDSHASFAGAARDDLTRLAQLDMLEQAVRRVRRVTDVDDIDPRLVRELLGEASYERLQRLTGSLAAFERSGNVRVGAGGRLELSARALQALGEWLLAAVFERLSQRLGGDHTFHGRASGPELSGVTRPYRFGDPLMLDLSRTVLEAVKRGGGRPVRLDARDFAIFEHEESLRATTVLAIDLSRSMGERGYLLAAKRLALALTALIRERYPRDQLLLIGFSERARAMTASELPQLAWDRFGFGTNIQEALLVARGLLANYRGTQRNLILITDGEPTAHRDTDGAVCFNHPPMPETLAATYAEAERLRRDDVRVAMCVLSEQRQVVRFAEELARRAAGEALFTTPDDLAVTGIVAYGRSRRGRLS